MPELTIYNEVAPLMGERSKCSWRIGPLGVWKVGDELAIPERPDRMGADRPGCKLARVTTVDIDGVATATDVKVLDNSDALTRRRT